MQDSIDDSAKKSWEDETETDDSVYMKKDGTVLQRVVIEGEDKKFLMDNEGNIYDMEGTFIGKHKLEWVKILSQ